MNKNIVLVGFMGAGKSLVSSKLENLADLRRLSTDDIIEQKENRKISDIFGDSGEPYFRKVERDVVAEVSQQDGLVIDCGGGVVLDDDNIRHLKKNGTVFYLFANPDVIYGRIKDETHRPLLQIDDPQAKIVELLEARKSRYELADHIIDTNNMSVDEVCEEIMKLMKK